MATLREVAVYLNSLVDETMGKPVERNAKIIPNKTAGVYDYDLGAAFYLLLENGEHFVIHVERFD